ncbi:hypothetical protein JXO59_10825 [candidate division KSB1 bacterium]|nr:hypothetical protein [candidate division KSB1 bacterium]
MTSNPGNESHHRLLPDGLVIAFTGE